MPRSFQKFIVILAIITALGSIVTGGERGPGPYAGVVIFDHWDTCYIYSGVYLMYIAKAQKESLRKYAGQSILLDAKEVLQPINPGDGLISKFDYVGPAEVKEDLPAVEGLKLEVKQIDKRDQVSFELTIRNDTDKAVEVSTNDVAPTLLGKKDEDDVFSPSDGKSDAKITRCSLKTASGVLSQRSFTRKLPNGRYQTVTKRWSVNVEHMRTLPARFQLSAGQARKFIITFVVPVGEYDFLCGYGGGVLEGKVIASNIISFSVDKNGRASRRTFGPKKTWFANGSSPSFAELIFHNFFAESYFAHDSL
jgi:hypothetical protein